MTEKEIVLEEILLAYLRTSKKINLANIEIAEVNDTQDRYTVTFVVDKDFGNTLMRPLNYNPFSKIFDEESRN